MKHTSFRVNGLYRAIPEGSQVPIDAENVQIFDTLDALQASQEYIDAIQAQNDGYNADEVNWMRSRDEILSSAVVTYGGNYIDMSPESQLQLAKVRESLGRRSKKVKWKVKSIADGSVLRVELSKTDINKISDAVIDASQIVHLAADTGFPVNPWPLAVT